MRCGAFHRVEGTLCLVRHGQAALSGSKTKAPGFAGGYLLLARTSDGRTRAKARGLRFGRPPALTPHQRQEAIQRLADGHSQADVARSYNVSQATISRLEPSPFGPGLFLRVKSHRG
jgi:DNA-binding NarL/FixJ family response regulator